MVLNALVLFGVLMAGVVIGHHLGSESFRHGEMCDGFSTCLARHMREQEIRQRIVWLSSRLAAATQRQVPLHRESDHEL